MDINTIEKLIKTLEPLLNVKGTPEEAECYEQYNGDSTFNLDPLDHLKLHLNNVKSYINNENKLRDDIELFYSDIKLFDYWFKIFNIGVKDSRRIIHVKDSGKRKLKTTQGDIYKNLLKVWCINDEQYESIKYILQVLKEKQIKRPNKPTTNKSGILGGGTRSRRSKKYKRRRRSRRKTRKSKRRSRRKTRKSKRRSRRKTLKRK